MPVSYWTGFAKNLRKKTFFFLSLINFIFQFLSFFQNFSFFEGEKFFLKVWIFNNENFYLFLNITVFSKNIFSSCMSAQNLGGEEKIIPWKAKFCISPFCTLKTKLKNKLKTIMDTIFHEYLSCKLWEEHIQFFGECNEKYIFPTKPGHFSRTLSKGPNTTTWIWNLHADAHDFDSHTSDLEEISRKVFSAHFGQLGVIFIWLSGGETNLLKQQNFFSI